MLLIEAKLLHLAQTQSHRRRAIQYEARIRDDVPAAARIRPICSTNGPRTWPQRGKLYKSIFCLIPYFKKTVDPISYPYIAMPIVRRQQQQGP